MTFPESLKTAYSTLTNIPNTYQLPFWAAYNGVFREDSSTTHVFDNDLDSFAAYLQSSEGIVFNKNNAADFQDPQMLQRWENYILSTLVPASMITAAAISPKTIQTQLQIEYILVGNDALYQQCSDQNNILDYNAAVLTAVKNLLEYYNSKEDPIYAAGYPNSESNETMSVILQRQQIPDDALNTIYNKVLGTGTSYGGKNLYNYLKDFSDGVKNDTITSYSQAIRQSLKNTADQIDLVLADLQQYIYTGSTSVNTLAKAWRTFWPYNVTLYGDSANVSTNLQNAISLLEHLHDNINVDLKNTMFIFEEFYKSASKLISRLQQVLSLLSSNIRS